LSLSPVCAFGFWLAQDPTGETRKMGMWRALKKMYTDDGVKGFFRGNGANMLRIFPFSAIQLSVYPMYKQLLGLGGTSSNDPKTGPVMVRMFASGCLAGITATTFTYPLDFIRSRLSLQSSHNQVRALWSAAALSFSCVRRVCEALGSAPRTCFFSHFCSSVQPELTLLLHRAH
jgi:hypothetical protein